MAYIAAEIFQYRENGSADLAFAVYNIVQFILNEKKIKITGIRQLICYLKKQGQLTSEAIGAMLKGSSIDSKVIEGLVEVLHAPFEFLEENYVDEINNEIDYRLWMIEHGTPSSFENSSFDESEPEHYHSLRKQFRLIFGYELPGWFVNFKNIEHEEVLTFLKLYHSERSAQTKD